MLPAVLIALRESPFRREMAGWVVESGFDPFVTDRGREALDWVARSPRGITFLDRGLERVDGEEVWRVVRPIVGRRLVLMAETRTKELWFSTLSEGLGSLLPLPAERDAVLTALRLVSAR